MFKKQVPLLLGSVAGFLVVLELFLPIDWMKHTSDHLFEWGQILAAAALVLGGLNLIQVNMPKIRRREEDWHYKVVLLVSAAAMLSFGIPWHLIGENPSAGQVTVGPGGAPGGKALLRIEPARADAVVKIDGGAVPIDGQSAGQATVNGAAREIVLEPGKHTVTVYMEPAGYAELSQPFEVAAGQTAIARAELPMTWGLTGRFRSWVYFHIFLPCQATMFALLAFFIASAAFRAFRARNTEAALLLGAAIIVLLGRAPVGAYIHDWLPLWTNWIIDVPNNAGRRAILMGAALGAIVTGLRVLLGMERQHVGGD